MDDFLLVAGTNWSEVSDAYSKFAPFASLSDINNYVQGAEWIALSQLLEDAGEIVPNTQVAEVRVVNTSAGENEYRLWFRIN